MRRIRHQSSVGIEHRAGEVEPLLDVHGSRRVLQNGPHLLRDRHEQIGEHFEQDGVDILRRQRSGPRRDPRQHGPIAHDLRPPALFDNNGLMRLDQQGRASILRRPQALHSYARLPPCTLREEGGSSPAVGEAGERWSIRGRRLLHRLHLHRPTISARPSSPNPNCRACASATPPPSRRPHPASLARRIAPVVPMCTRTAVAITLHPARSAILRRTAQPAHRCRQRLPIYKRFADRPLLHRPQCASFIPYADNSPE